jgi:hypothetical protein
MSSICVDFEMDFQRVIQHEMRRAAKPPVHIELLLWRRRESRRGAGADPVRITSRGAIAMAMVFAIYILEGRCILTTAP